MAENSRSAVSLFGGGMLGIDLVGHLPRTAQRTTVERNAIGFDHRQDV
jgi:hypothetical protein